MTNTVAGAFDQLVYAVEETTKGTVALPTAAAEKIIAAGSATMNQQANFSDSKEINNSLDVVERFQDQSGPGSWSCPFYIRPSGAKGTPPMGKVMLKSLMGLETIVGATSVTYAQATTKPSFTYWVKKDHTVFFAAGACAESGKPSFSNKGGSEIAMSGGFMSRGWAGTDAANGATANGTGAGYVSDLIAGYAIGDTAIHVDTGTGTILEGDTVTFAGDANVYFIVTGYAGDGDGDIVLRSPGLVQTLADDVAMTITGNSKITVDDGEKFTADALIQIASDDNTNAGYQIASVSTNKLFMKEVVTCADDAVVKGFLPVFTAVGSPLENKDLTITFDGTAKNLKSLSADISSPVAWQSDEITTSGNTEEYVEDKRKISLSVDVLFRENDLSYFYDAVNNTKVAIVATNNDDAGEICVINFPYTELEVPDVQDSAPTISLSIKGTALGSSGEDSCTIVFT